MGGVPIRLVFVILPSSTRIVGFGFLSGQFLVLSAAMPYGYCRESMELRHFRYFIAVAELLNFTKAAARLRVAQPALSRQIRDLEGELGVPLFERNSRFVRLTDAGEAFLIDARDVLLRADAAARTVHAFAVGERGEVRVG